MYRRLKVAVFFTGDELVEPGEAAPAGKIYNSNRYWLVPALRQLGCEVIDLGIIADRLDATRAAAVLASDAFADEVREREQFFTGHGIHSVPAVIINDRHLISGGQPSAVFEQALRQIAAGAA